VRFLLINILSLLPNSKCDGGRAYEIFKKMGIRAFSLCMMSILVYVLYVLGLKLVMPIKENETQEKGGKKMNSEIMELTPKRKSILWRYKSDEDDSIFVYGISKGRALALSGEFCC